MAALEHKVPQIICDLQAVVSVQSLLEAQLDLLQLQVDTGERGLKETLAVLEHCTDICQGYKTQPADGGLELDSVLQGTGLRPALMALDMCAESVAPAAAAAKVQKEQLRVQTDNAELGLQKALVALEICSLLQQQQHQSVSDVGESGVEIGDQGMEDRVAAADRCVAASQSCEKPASALEASTIKHGAGAKARASVAQSKRRFSSSFEAELEDMQKQQARVAIDSLSQELASSALRPTSDFQCTSASSLPSAAALLSITQMQDSSSPAPSVCDRRSLASSQDAQDSLCPSVCHSLVVPSTFTVRFTSPTRLTVPRKRHLCVGCASFLCSLRPSLSLV